MRFHQLQVQWTHLTLLYPEKQERFVNEIHDHKEELRSSNELLTELQGSGRSESYGERKGRTSSNKETCASPFSNPPPRATLYTQRTIPTHERKWKAIHAHAPDGGYLAVGVSKMVTKMLRHYDQDERQTDGSRQWDTIRPKLVKAFAQEGARDFDEGFWLHLIHVGSNKKRLEYCKDNNGSLCYLRAIQGHSDGIPISPEFMNYTLFHTNGRSTSFTQEFRGIFNPFWRVK